MALFIASAASQHAMGQRGKLFAHLGDALGIDVAGNDARALLELCDEYPPRVDQHRMSERAASARMHAALRGSKDVALVFDGAAGLRYLGVRGTEVVLVTETLPAPVRSAKP